MVKNESGICPSFFIMLDNFSQEVYYCISEAVQFNEKEVEYALEVR